MTAYLETRLRDAAAAVNEAERERDVPPFRSSRPRRRRRGPVLAVAAVAAGLLLVVGMLWERDDGRSTVADAPVEISGLFPGPGGSAWSYDVSRNGVPEAELAFRTEPVVDGSAAVRLQAAWRVPDAAGAGPPAVEVVTTLPLFDDGRFAVPLAVLLPSAETPCTDVEPVVIDPNRPETTGTAVLSCGDERIRIGVVATTTVRGYVLVLDSADAEPYLPTRLELDVVDGVGLTAFDLDGSVVGVLADPPDDEQGAEG